MSGNLSVPFPTPNVQVSTLWPLLEIRRLTWHGHSSKLYVVRQDEANSEISIVGDLSIATTTQFLRQQNHLGSP